MLKTGDYILAIYLSMDHKKVAKVRGLSDIGKGQTVINFLKITNLIIILSKRTLKLRNFDLSFFKSFIKELSLKCDCMHKTSVDQHVKLFL